MKRKLLITALAVVTALVCSFGLFACQNSGGGETTKDTVEFTLVTKELALNVSQTAQIETLVKINGVTSENENLTYKTSDAAVASVNEDGFVTGTGKGTAEITVTLTHGAEKKEGKVTVTVTETVEFELLTRKLNLGIGETGKIETLVKINGKADESEKATFKSSDEAVAAVDENGNVSATGKGTATVTVTYARGEKNFSGSVEITVTEIVSIETNVNNGELVLYTTAGDDANNPLPTEFALTVKVFVNGKEASGVTSEIVSADESVVKIKDGKIVAEGKGETIVTVSYVTEHGTTAKEEINVSVVAPTIKTEIKETVKADASRGLNFRTELNLLSVESAFSGEDEFPATLNDDGSVSVNIEGLPSGGISEIVITASSAKEVYEITVRVEVYDILIGSKQDFADFLGMLGNDSYIYALLTSNIDLENEPIKTKNNASDASGDAYTTSFSLDGNGFTVLRLSATGVRGAIAERIGKNNAGKDSVIKNIAFENFAFKDSSAGGLFVTAANLSLTDVYFSGSVNYWTGSVVALWTLENVSYKNVAAYVTEIGNAGASGGHVKDTETLTGAPIGVFSSLGVANEQKPYENVYAVSDKAQKLMRGVCEGEGDDMKDKLPCTLTEGLYADMDSFSVAVKTLPSGFGSDMWKINDDGKLVFVTVPEQRKTVIDFAEDKIILGEHGLNVGTKNGSSFVTEGAPAGAKDSVLHITDTNQWHGFSVNFAQPLDYEEGMSEIAVRFYLSKRTELRFYTLFDTTPAAEYKHDKLENVDGGKWYEVKLEASHYVENGKINGFRFLDCTGSEIWIDSVTVYYAD